MKRVHKLSEEEIEKLTYEYKNAPKHHFRLRCQGILLSNEGFSVSEIGKRLGKDVDSIYSWISRYEQGGTPNLQNRKGQGQKATLGKLTEEQIVSLEDAVKNEPQNLNKVSEELSVKFDLKINKRMLIRFLKKN